MKSELKTINNLYSLERKKYFKLSDNSLGVTSKLERAMSAIVKRNGENNMLYQKLEKKDEKIKNLKGLVLIKHNEIKKLFAKVQLSEFRLEEEVLSKKSAMEIVHQLQKKVSHFYRQLFGGNNEIK